MARDPDIEDGLIRLGMIRDMVMYLSDAEGGGRLDAPGSSLNPAAKSAALSLIAWEIGETVERMYEAMRIERAKHAA